MMKVAVMAYGKTTGVLSEETIETDSADSLAVEETIDKLDAASNDRDGVLWAAYEIRDNTTRDSVRADFQEYIQRRRNNGDCV